MADACINDNDRFGGGASVMVTGRISARDRTYLISIRNNLNSQRYPNDILDHVVNPFMLADPDIVEFQQECASNTFSTTTSTWWRGHQHILIFCWSRITGITSSSMWDANCDSDEGCKHQCQRWAHRLLRWTILWCNEDVMMDLHLLHNGCYCTSVITNKPRLLLLMHYVFLTPSSN